MARLPTSENGLSAGAPFSGVLDPDACSCGWARICENRRPALGADGRVPRTTQEAFALSFLIRVQLPDSPGTLGAVASALGKIGADILSVDVVERGSGVAVDDLVVELPSGRLPDMLITAAESIEGVEVDAVRPYAGVLDTHRELELVEEVAAEPKAGLRTFTEGVPKIIRAGWAVVVATDPGGTHPLAASTAAPQVLTIDLPFMPLAKATVLDGEERAGHRAGRDAVGQTGPGATGGPSGRADVPRRRGRPPRPPGRDRRGRTGRLGRPTSSPARRSRSTGRGGRPGSRP
jgi:hypothetical protein